MSAIIYNYKIQYINLINISTINIILILITTIKLTTITIFFSIVNSFSFVYIKQKIIQIVKNLLLIIKLLRFIFRIILCFKKQ